MNNENDIQKILSRVAGAYPDVRNRQLHVAHPGVDDDGMWFFKREGQLIEVQLESSSGNCPFLVETNTDGMRHQAKTVDEALSLLIQLLYPVSGAKTPPGAPPR